MYCVIDIETTGGSAKQNKITEIAIIRYDGQEIVDEFTSLVNPETSIPPFITRLTGIDNEMVADAPKFYEIAKKVVEITEDAIFVAHNVAFDYGFVREEFARLGYDYKRERLCTVRTSRRVFPGYPSYSLANLTQFLGVELANHHRAYNDAFAAFQILEMLLEANPEETLKNKVKGTGKKRKKVKHHPKLSSSRIEALPEETGVYYLFDEKGELIYLGKSTNIRSRVLSHLSNQSTEKSKRLQASIADIDWEVTGSELLALLQESEEIKTNKPIFNRAQRRSIFHYGLFDGQDEGAYRRLELRAIPDQGIPLHTYSSKMEGRAHLYKLCEKYQLCQNLCGLYKSSGPCFHYNIKQCKGACVGEEDPSEYNKRVQQALEELAFDKESFIVLDKGRIEEEVAVVWVENGRYMGFGYADQTEALNLDDLKDSVNSRKHNRDVSSILKAYLRRKKVKKIIHLEDSFSE